MRIWIGELKTKKALENKEINKGTENPIEGKKVKVKSIHMTELFFLRFRGKRQTLNNLINT